MFKLEEETAVEAVLSLILLAFFAGSNAKESRDKCPRLPHNFAFLLINNRPKYIKTKQIMTICKDETILFGNNLKIVPSVCNDGTISFICKKTNVNTVV